MTSKHKQAGVLSIDAAMALLVLSILITLASVWTIKQIDAQDFKVASDKQRAVAEAFSKYLKDNFNTVLANATATVPAQITVEMLVNTNYLPVGFSETNAFGQAIVGLARKPNANQLEAIVLTIGGQQISEIGIRTIAENLGGPGGFISSASPNVIQGTRGGWQLTLSNFAIDPGPGHTASALFLMDGALANDYLYRGAVPGHPELNTMNTNLNMGGNSITNSATVNTQALVTGTLKVEGLAEEGARCAEVGLIASNVAGKLLGCDGEFWGKATDMPNAHRYLFTESADWVVPKGVKSALVTMAGGGGSGYGWRFSNNYSTGSSGGYVFSAPINLVEGEVIKVVVGAGGKSYYPYDTGAITSNGYSIYAAPTDDDGLGGYPGTSSMLISPTSGTLLECAGAHGAATYGVDNFEGSWVPGPLKGAMNGSGRPLYPTPQRLATGNYTNNVPGGPGACGPQSYGIGNTGNQSFSISSGLYAGGSTPFGYGSGGSVQIIGCYVAEGSLGICIFPSRGRDGVVMIDVLY